MDSHTLGACSTIGPARLNLRRLEGVSARPLRAGASAEILSVLREGSLTPRLQKESDRPYCLGRSLIHPARCTLHPPWFALGPQYRSAESL